MGKVILIVDDEERNRKLARSILSAPGFDTIEAIDGRQGVSMAQSLKPDLILMNLKMPVMNGYKALELLKQDENTRNIPVIAVSGMLMDEEIEEALGAGFKDLVSKPIDIALFLASVTNCLSGTPRTKGLTHELMNSSLRSSCE